MRVTFQHHSLLTFADILAAFLKALLVVPVLETNT